MYPAKPVLFSKKCRDGYIKNQESRCASTKCRTFGSGTRIIVILLLDNLPVLYKKCVEYIKRLVVGEATPLGTISSTLPQKAVLHGLQRWPGCRTASR